MFCLVLQAGLNCCMAALQSPSCPGTATFSHLWGPVCADVLYVQPEQQHSQQSQWGTAAGELKQHQAPGLVKLIPLMGQMDELRRKVVHAAADVVALALQVILSHLVTTSAACPQSYVVCGSFAGLLVTCQAMKLSQMLLVALPHSLRLALKTFNHQQ